ncbi:hypothetical protein CsSME_00009874 [Camellia sinensis var. sinensis]
MAGSNRNKWDFFVFLCMGALSSFLGAIVAVQNYSLIHYDRNLDGTNVIASWRNVDSFCGSSTSWSGSFSGYGRYHFSGCCIFVDSASIPGYYRNGTAGCWIARNLTTNEAINSVRYAYLRNPDGRFRNPYNHGCRKNCSDFLIQGYTNDDEIAWPPLQEVAREREGPSELQQYTSLRRLFLRSGQLFVFQPGP